MSFDEHILFQVLDGAARRIETGWARGHQARTGEGEPVRPEDPTAESWCTFGAIRAAALARFPFEPRTGVLLAEAVAKRVGVALAHSGFRVTSHSAPRTLMEWNDETGRSQDEVLELYRVTMSGLQPRRSSEGQAQSDVGAVHAG